MEIKPIAEYHCALGGKFGLPRQAGLASSLKGEIKLLPPYNSAESIRGLEGFNYIWIIWGFNLNKNSESLTVRPPRLGGNKRVGVFASRSPFRPNSLGLSCVRLETINSETCIISVSGADLADGTPIFDIKPYIGYSDSHPDAACGFVDSKEWTTLEVKGNKPDGLSDEEFNALREILAQDPRPAYQDNPNKIYGLIFKGRDIHFRVFDGIVEII